MTEGRVSALVWALLAAVVWGSVPLLEKVGLNNSDPVVGVYARSVGLLLGVLVCALFSSPWQALGNLSVRTFVLLGLGGFLASFLGQIAFYQALKVGDVSMVTPLAGTYPLVALALSWIVLREPITTARATGAVLIVLGILLLRR
jgi:transporter family protein